jgi:hypothetical protein
MKLVALTLLLATGSLKVALTLVPRPTFDAPRPGVTLATVGGVVSGVAVVNDQLSFEVSGFPAWSVIPPGPPCRVAV